MNPKIDRLLNHAKIWKEEMKELREVILECGVCEELKWRLPCYTFNGHNIVIIQSFKGYCAVMFFKGALLKDLKNVLVPLGSSQAARQIRFTSLPEVKKLRSILKSYIKEAIRIEKTGLKVKLKKTEDFKVPAEFQKKLDQLPKLRVAYEALTPGRQRAYLHYFSQAKQSKTREQRVDKYLKQILSGKGIKD